MSGVMEGHYGVSRTLQGQFLIRVVGRALWNQQGTGRSLADQGEMVGHWEVSRALGGHCEINRTLEGHCVIKGCWEGPVGSEGRWKGTV